MNASTAVASSDFTCDLRHLVTQTVEIMACYGSSRQYLAVSPALAELCQCSAAAWVGQTDLNLMAQHPQSLA